MKLTLKRIEPRPVMIGPEQARMGDVIANCFGKMLFVHSVGGDRPSVLDGDGGIQKWREGKSRLLSRIDWMPKSEGYRLGDLPLGAIVPGSELVSKTDGMWFVLSQNSGDTSLKLYGGNKYCLQLASTRVYVAYEPIELVEPE